MISSSDVRWKGSRMLPPPAARGGSPLMEAVKEWCHSEVWYGVCAVE